jgi:hypothetical protein
VNARKIIPLKEFLRPGIFSGLEASGRSLYCAYSIVLVELLVHTPDGQGRLARFIADLPTASNNPMADLGRHFPELSNASSAEKTWSLRIAGLAAGQPFQLFSAEETEQKLEKLLALGISGAGPERTYQLEEFSKFTRSASSKAHARARSPASVTARKS